MNRVRIVLLGALALGVPALAQAQSSQFGVRGLGLPSFPFSIRTQGSGGAGGLFDPASAVNPASLFLVTRPIASFNMIHNWRSSENRYGTASGNDTQFPLFIAGGQISSRLAGGVSASVYTDRTFSLATEDSVELRGIPTAVFDTLESRGGLNDLRFAAAYRGDGVAFGLGFHLMTGTNRLGYRRVFADSSYARVESLAEMSFIGVGLSAGVIVAPNDHLWIGATARWDGDLSMEVDTLKAGKLPLPVTLSGGIQWSPSSRLSVGGHVIRQGWSKLDQPLKDRGGSGASSTLSASAGFELARSARTVDRFPLRMGLRWASLPFPLEDGLAQGSEFGVSAGTGFAFGGGRGVLDLAFERIWRQQDSGFSEKAFAVKLGVTIRQ